ncbi:uncharacterized protein LOC126576539 [Anopheles aquasalis]|uniref:uncharacterized protein LOC126576539 n=1 Tax=Anopheles aquasalis TaxID=42839 RepID=UPI00215AD8BD|nr:uncharacterized protein LOC126576539 [Anopheles aquasalis]
MDLVNLLEVLVRIPDLPIRNILDWLFWIPVLILEWLRRTAIAIQARMAERRFRRLSRGPCIKGDPMRAWEVARLSPEQYEDLWNAGLGEALRRWEFPDEEDED